MSPWFINAFFTAVTPFLDPITKEKIRFNANLADFVPKEQLDVEFAGGRYNYEWDFKTYWDTLIEKCGIAKDGSRTEPKQEQTQAKEAVAVPVQTKEETQPKLHQLSTQTLPSRSMPTPLQPNSSPVKVPRSDSVLLQVPLPLLPSLAVPVLLPPPLPRTVTRSHPPTPTSRTKTTMNRSSASTIPSSSIAMAYSGPATKPSPTSFPFFRSSVNAANPSSLSPTTPPSLVRPILKSLKV